MYKNSPPIYDTVGELISALIIPWLPAPEEQYIYRKEDLNNPLAPAERYILLIINPFKQIFVFEFNIKTLQQL
jgi:hypothetical protein